MKLLRFDLRSFGSFSHETFNFDPSKNIHVIYGENEAGKSSFTRAIKALLFGIDKNSVDAYMHLQENLFLEGLIESESGKIIQIARNSKSARKQNELLTSYFPKLTKESYSSIYCLNQTVLQMGSKDLLENIKHFDVSLFSAIKGKDGVVNLLKKIEKDLEELYKPRGSKPLLNQKIQRLTELLEEKANNNKTYDSWKHLQDKKKSLIEKVAVATLKYKRVKEKELIYKNLKEIYTLLEDYKELKMQVESTNLKDHFDENSLKVLEKLVNESKQISAREMLLKTSIQNLEKEIHNNSCNPELVEMRIPLELLTNEAQIVNSKKIIIRENEEKLQSFKLKFRKLNLDLQEKINCSLTFKEWEKLKEKLIQVSQNMRVENEKLNNKKEIFEEQLKLINDQIQISIANLNKNNFITKTINENELNIFGDSYSYDVNTLLLVQQEVQDLLADYFYTEEKLKEIKNQVSISNSSSNLNFDEYEALKFKRNHLKNELLKPWSLDNYLDKYKIFNKLQLILDLEDIEISNIFNNLDIFSKNKKLNDELIKMERKLQSLRTKLAPFQSQILDFLSFYKEYFLEFDLYGKNNLNKLLFTLTEIQKLLTLINRKKILYENIKKLEKDKNESKYFKEWKKYCDKFDIKILYTESNLSILIKNLDDFFNISKLITDINITIKNDLEVISKTENAAKQLGLKSGFTDINLNNLSLYKSMADEEFKKKERHGNFLFLKNSKIKDLNLVEELNLKNKTNIEKILTINKCKSSFKVSDLVGTSFDFFAVSDKLYNLKNILNLKTKPRNIKFFLRLKSFFLGKHQIDNRLDSIEKLSEQLSHENENYQKEIGEVDYLQKEYFSFQKKFAIDAKLQSEKYDLYELLDKYLIANSAYKIIKETISDFQNHHHHFVLEKASLFFEKITNGKYKKVYLNILNQKESFLICESKSSEKVTVDLLSEGTRDQLFLSIKLAIGELYIQGFEKFPIVLDDILVNYDDERTCNVLKVLECVSNKSQIIFLTHHKHMVDHFTSTLGDNLYQLHSLGSKQNA